MSKTLIIHPLDKSTNFLKIAYKFAVKSKLVDVISSNYGVKDNNIVKQTLRNEIPKYDTIFMLGHGNENGLVDASGNLLIDDSFAEILKGKACFGLWCNAKDFFTKHKLNGIATGMIVSDTEEAQNYIKETWTNGDLEFSNEMLASALKMLILGGFRYCDYTGSNYQQSIAEYTLFSYHHSQFLQCSCWSEPNVIIAFNAAIFWQYFHVGATQIDFESFYGFNN